MVLSQLYQLLQNAGFQQYYRRLVDHGYDSLEHLNDINDEDMATLNIKLGHRRALQRLSHRADGDPAPSSQVSSPRSPSDQEDAPRQKRRYRRKPAKDPNAPKPPDSGYVQFTKAMREDPDIAALPFISIAKLIGEKWSALTPDERDVWNSQAADERKEYKIKLAAYKNRLQTSIDGLEDGTDSEQQHMPQATDSQIQSMDLMEMRHVETEIQLPTPGSSSLDTSPAMVKSDRDEGSKPILETLWALLSHGDSGGSSGPVADNHQRVLSSHAATRSRSFRVEALNPFNFMPPSSIWPIMDSFQQNINSVYYLVNAKYLLRNLDLIFQGGVDLPNDVMCTLCLCMAIGCQTSSDLSDDVTIMWYENGRRYLDDDNWTRDLAFVRALALISIYHMSERPATSRYYLYMAMSIGGSGSNNHTGTLKNDREAEGEGVDEWRRVCDTIQIIYRVLVWGLSITCSEIPTEFSGRQNSTLDRTDMTLTSQYSPFSSLSRQLEEILREVGAPGGLRQSKIDVFLEQVGDWYGSLPNDCILPSDPSTQRLDMEQMQHKLVEMSPAAKSVLVHLHALYLGIICLLTRSALHRLIDRLSSNESSATANEADNSVYKCLGSALLLIELCTAYTRAGCFPRHGWLPLCVCFEVSSVCALGVIWQQKLVAADASTPSLWLEWSLQGLQNVLYVFAASALTNNEQGQRFYDTLLRTISWMGYEVNNENGTLSRRSSGPVSS